MAKSWTLAGLFLLVVLLVVVAGPHILLWLFWVPVVIFCSLLFAFYLFETHKKGRKSKSISRGPTERLQALRETELRELEGAAEQQRAAWIQTVEIYDNMEPGLRERLRVAVEERIKQQDLVIGTGDIEAAIVKLYQTGIKRQAARNR